MGCSTEAPLDTRDYKQPMGPPGAEEELLRASRGQKCVSPPRRGQRVKFAVTSVHDGDTIKGYYMVGDHGGRLDTSIRLEGIDAPELDVPEQRQAGVVCRDWLSQALGFKPNQQEACVIDVEIKRWDKYGGRIVGRLYVGDTDICHQMLNLQLAQPHNGRQRKDTWPPEKLARIVTTFSPGDERGV